METNAQITLKDRETILKLSAIGWSQRKIAAEIGENQYNISRELRRAGMDQRTYRS